MFTLPKQADKNSPATLVELERSLEMDRRAKIAELKEAEVEAGNQLIERALGIDGGIGQIPVASTADRVHSELQSINHAIIAVRRRRVEAIRAEYLAQAQAKREQADREREELAVIEKKTIGLLAKLSEIEGVAYTRQILLCEAFGHWYTNLGKPVELCNPYERGGDIDSGFYMPRSLKLWESIRELTADAGRIEEREVQTQGTITAVGYEELLSKLHTDAKIIAPTVVEVEELFKKCEKVFREDEKRAIREFMPRRFTLAWSSEEVTLTMSVGDKEYYAR